MAGKHSARNPEAPTAMTPAQWIEPAVDGPPPSGDGPAQHVPGESAGALLPEDGLGAESQIA